MYSRTLKPFLWLVSLLVIVGMACSFGASGDKPEATEENNQAVVTEASQTTEETEETSAPTNGSVSSIDDLQSAVIQIEVEGTMVEPDFSVSYNAAGRGSGFIIDPSGIAVTNNHVVTGGGILKVWVGGDTDRTYNAKVLGVSECSDLAVIKIEGGKDFPYLEWYEGPIKVGLNIYAAGFPLGDPQFTLTKGIVTKEEAFGESSFASVDYLIEYDAVTNPGSSGGPIITEDAKVVAVHSQANDADQRFGISRDLARTAIETLRSGQDMETIGVNGFAFANEGYSGIWVSSVESGSPADKAGIRGGDIITTLENLILGLDGTKADYCDILRTHNSGDVLAVEVLRWATGEVLQGQINGEKMATVADFSNDLESSVEGESTVDSTGTYSGYSTVTDDYGAISIAIPNEWVDVNGSNWLDGDVVIGSAISAAPNLDNFNNTWTESGVFFGASDDLARLGGYVQLLDITRSDFQGACKLQGRYDYEDDAFRGRYDLYTNCNNEGSVFFVLTAVPKANPESMLILVEMQITKEVDYDALDQILASFDVVGILP